MPGWKSKKNDSGKVSHFKDEKIKRDSSSTDEETNIAINDDELDSFANEKKSEFHDNEIKIEGTMLDDMGWGLVEGEDYEITEYGSVHYIGGFEKVLETLGAKELDYDDVKKLASKIETDPELANLKDDRDVEQYLSYKEDNNTFNYSSAISHDLNYGFIKDEEDERTYIVFAQHISGDVRTNYERDRIFDITNLDNGATGEPDGDLSVLLDPRLRTSVSFNGKKYDVESDGGMSGNQWFDESGTYLDNDEIEKELSGAKNNFADAFESFIKSKNHQR